MLDASSNRISSPQLFLIFSRIRLTSFGGGLSGWLLGSMHTPAPRRRSHGGSPPSPR